jgi:FkbM family methyltransferase
MNAWTMKTFTRPEYIYQPNRLVRRVFSKGRNRRGEEIVELPWKLSLEVDSSEIIGWSIACTGIFEMPVVEAMFRLVDGSDTVLDVGANIGYMTAVALSAGANNVISFEPHPVLFGRLLRNVQRWDKEPRFAGRVNVRNEAIDSEKGHATLFVRKDYFAGNQGIATLEARMDKTAYDEIEVTTATLDSVINGAGGPVGMLKIDIEGHEFQAFKGASDSLRKGLIRDIIYECLEGADSEVSKLLASYGYSIFGLRSSLTGPVLLGAMDGGRLPLGEHNLVATCEPDRFRKRMSPRGYKCLSRAARSSDLRESQDSHSKLR